MRTTNQCARRQWRTRGANLPFHSLRIFHEDGRSVQCLIMRQYKGRVVNIGEIEACQWEGQAAVPKARLADEVVVGVGMRRVRSVGKMKGEVVVVQVH